jgi:hypothetical protein
VRTQTLNEGKTTVPRLRLQRSAPPRQFLQNPIKLFVHVLESRGGALSLSEATKLQKLVVCSSVHCPRQCPSKSHNPIPHTMSATPNPPVQCHTPNPPVQCHPKRHPANFSFIYYILPDGVARLTGRRGSEHLTARGRPAKKIFIHDIPAFYYSASHCCNDGVPSVASV